MPRVYTKTKSSRGAERRCGNCGRPIAPGDTYYSWSFRYGGTQFRCSDHYPKMSELTQSKMSAVYDAIETAQETVAGATEVSEIRDAIEAVAEVVQEVAGEYRDAAEPFGGTGENADRADELEGYGDELASFDPVESDVEEFDEDEHDEEAKERSDADGCSYTEAMQALREEFEAEQPDPEDDVTNAREEADTLLQGCPL